MDSTKIISAKITIINLGPKFGCAITPLWFAFHDGSFKPFTSGCPASTGIEQIAEDGFTGIDLLIDDIFNNQVVKGLPIQNLPPYSKTMGGIFAASSAGIKGGIQGVLYPDPISPNGIAFFPGDSNTTVRNLNGNFLLHRYFSFAAMVFPSNDAFMSAEDLIDLFDDTGKFVGADFIFYGNQVWDAGTEVNDESSTNVPFSLASFGKGKPENGVVKIHPGLKPRGSGGVLDVTPLLANADFKRPNYQVARIIISEL
jgi:hypothetical protein